MLSDERIGENKRDIMFIFNYLRYYQILATHRTTRKFNRIPNRCLKGLENLDCKNII